MLFAVLLAFAFCASSHWAVELEKGVDPAQFALEHGLTYVERIADFDIFEANTENSNMNFQMADNVISAVQQKARKHYTRSINSDPLYSSQWHLRVVNATAAWDAGYFGSKVVIGIVDDGLQHSHPDLAANYAARHSWDFNYNDRDPSPSRDDGHGTSAAGVAAAVRNNGHCGSGVAPRAKIAGLRLIARAVYDYVEAKALSYHRNAIKIYSCSWGPPDEAMDMVGPGQVTKNILKSGYAAGSIFVWAGGNGRGHGDNINYDGYANNIHTIAIGAIDSNGNQAYYSESGAPLFAVTPSNGASKGIVTTDLMGPYGYSNGECTMNFGGTSSAAPLAAGIVALLVQKHPHLDARGVQHLIARGATKIHTSDSDWTHHNVHGITHSHKYGFGLLEISKLLETPLPHYGPLKVIQTGFIKNLRMTLPCEKSFRIAKPLGFIEQVEVIVSFYSNKRGNVEILLVKDGVTSILAEKHGDRHRGMTTWTYTTVRHWGDTNLPTSEWTVKLRGSESQLRGVGIKVYGF